jgi:hypothetical protein
MILNPKETTVAYRCPACGAGVMSAVGIFALSAEMIKLKCTCGQSEMKITYSNEGQVRLSVPCMFCPTPHSFVVNKNVFFGKDLFTLQCPYSDINIACTGETNLVKAELARTELELLDLLAENGIDDLSALQGEEEQRLTDPQIFDIIMFVINDLDAEGKIYCKCPPKQPLPDGVLPGEEEGRYEAQVLEGGILVTCRDCGASRIIPTDSLLGAHAFLNADSLKLE